MQVFGARPQALLLAASIVALAAAPGDDPIPFPEFGQGFLKEHGGAKQVSDLPFEKFSAEWCVHARLGAFDVAYPIVFLGDKDHVDDLKTVCVHLLELEARWAEWLAAEPAKVQPVRAAVTTLQGWVKGWKSASFAHLPTGEKMKDNDLAKILSASEAEVKAAESLAGMLCTPDLLGVGPSEGGPLGILLSPTRRDFVELLGYAGLLDTEKQAELWTKTVSDYTTFWIDWEIVVAMQYPPWAADPQFKTGLAMDKFDKSGLEQHAVQQVANAWQWACYGDDGVPYLHQAVAMNLAIAVCGELNALDGDGWGYGTTGASTQPYEVFVPGGSSAGGILPPMPAAPLDAVKKGHWREGGGKDYFTGPLRRGQKEGQKAPKNKEDQHLPPALLEDKDAHFLLVSEDQSTKYVVSAPFFGPDSKTKPYPPAAVLLDYREFFRAYKSAFFHWLRTASDPKDPAGAAARFRELLRQASGRDASQPFEDLVQGIYKLPLSGKDGKTDSLEWRFLESLSKSK